MLPRDLYDVLQKVKDKQTHGVTSSLKPDSSATEDRKAFDRLVLKLQKLRSQGYVSFTDGQVLRDTSGSGHEYWQMMCQLTEDGERVLEYGSYEAYAQSQAQAAAAARTPAVLHIDRSDRSLRIGGNVSHTNIASHAHQVSQSLRVEDLTALHRQMLDTLQQDTRLSAQERQAVSEKIEALFTELQQSQPRPSRLLDAYSVIGNTASIAAYLPALQGLLAQWGL